MKNYLIQLVYILLISQNTFGQFKAFSKAGGGFAVAPTAMISSASIGLGGGGVILKGVAKSKYPDSLSAFTGITFKEARKISNINIQTKDITFSFSDSSWILRDAAMQVKSEKQLADSIHRDVNLLGKFNSEDYRKGYEVDSYFKVEVVDSLRGTRSGQTLIYMDIMLTEGNTKYYSSSSAAAEIYEASLSTLQKYAFEYNDSIERIRYEPLNDLYMKLKNLESLKQTGKLNHTEAQFLTKFNQYALFKLFDDKLGFWNFEYKNDTISYLKNEIDSFFRIPDVNLIRLKSHFDDYTYNDENVDYTFYISGNDKHLVVDGEPYYTFINHDYYEGHKVNSLFTDYFIQHPDIINNLNSAVVINARHYAKATAFFRYIKKEYPEIWGKTTKHYAGIPKTKGNTPRYISRYPPIE